MFDKTREKLTAPVQAIWQAVSLAWTALVVAVIAIIVTLARYAG